LLSRRIGVLVAAFAVVATFAGPAAAYEFPRTLKAGDKGADVKALQVRIAGWYPLDGQKAMSIDGVFGKGTSAAVRAFQTAYGLGADGIAGPSTFAIIDGLEDDDGSTIHFAWDEFTQNVNSRCSAKANAYAGTFKGGMVAPLRAKRNIKRVMWRLEAVRKKAGDNSIGINSAFRSASYNDCIGGAGASQHMYGTAVDNRMAAVSNRFQRDVARGSQFHGIGCYSSLSHNHFDIRLENSRLPSSQFWWWPEQDEKGRDLADDGKPCWGETSTKASMGTGARSVAALLPTQRWVTEFASAGEWYAGQGD
jgi:zinc D-Ala-D-Ala carboxypeptidase